MSTNFGLYPVLFCNFTQHFLDYQSSRAHVPQGPFLHSFCRQSHVCSEWVWSLPLPCDGSSAPRLESVCDMAFWTSHCLTPNCLDRVGHFSCRAGVLVFLGHALCFNASVFDSIVSLENPSPCAPFSQVTHAGTFPAFPGGVASSLV